MADWIGVDMGDRTCSIEGCESTHRMRRGLCNTHYLRLCRRGSTDLPVRPRAERTCSVDDCGSKHKARGYCKIHYLRMAQYGTIELRPRYETCTVPECSTEVRSPGTPHCEMHYGRMRRNGHLDYVGPERTDDPTYRTVHSRLRVERGPAADHRCVDCSGAAVDWSYDNSDPDERIDPKTGCAFSLDPDHYEPRCKRCHYRFDQHTAQRGKTRAR